MSDRWYNSLLGGGCLFWSAEQRSTWLILRKKVPLMNKNLIKQKSGFTLVELVVVMFLMGLVAIIATSITLMVNRSQQNYQIDSKSQAELLELETQFKGWLAHYDSAEYTLVVDQSNITALKTTSPNETEDEDLFIRFENGTLSYSTLEYEDKAVSFNSITSITFEFENDIVGCRVKFNDTDYEHMILYTMRVAKIAEASD